jgi:hypothetical protein
MANLVSIEDGIKTQKGSFIATIIKASELKEGTGKKGKYTMQRFTFADDSAEIELTAWNEETHLLQLGKKYEVAPWWQGDYEGTPQIGLGKFGKVKDLGDGLIPRQDTHQTTSVQETTTQPTTNNIPLLEASLKGIIHENTLLMLQIEQEVESTMKAVCKGEIRGDKVGMFTKMNFLHLKGMEIKN